MKKLIDILKEVTITPVPNEIKPYYNALRSNPKVNNGDLSSIYNILDNLMEGHDNSSDEIQKIFDNNFIKNYLEQVSINHNGFRSNSELDVFLENNLKDFIIFEIDNLWYWFRYGLDLDESLSDLDWVEVPNKKEMIDLITEKIQGMSSDGNDDICWGTDVEIGISYAAIPTSDPASYGWTPISFKGKNFYKLSYNI